MNVFLDCSYSFEKYIEDIASARTKVKIIWKYIEVRYI